MQEAIESGHHMGDGPFTARCQQLLEHRLAVPRALLTTSCTTALELAALLARRDAPLSEELEVIVPAYTFVSTVNAFVVHGYKPVFAEVRLDTCNLDETKLEALITAKTRAVVPVHYAGVPCAMDAINAIAKKHDLLVIEDAAQAIFSTYNGRPAGGLGDLACFSFHGTKNISCGEGGALTVVTEAFQERAEVLREKGTNRRRFLRGEVDKYTWVDIGGSYLPSDLLAAFLLAQLEAEQQVHSARRSRYRQYMDGFSDLHGQGKLMLPSIPEGIESNHHLFHVLLESEGQRNRLLDHLTDRGIKAVFHYGALHLSAMGKTFGPPEGSLPNAERVADTLLRLPLFPDLSDAQTAQVIDAVRDFFKEPSHP